MDKTVYELRKDMDDARVAALAVADDDVAWTVAVAVADAATHAYYAVAVVDDDDDDDDYDERMYDWERDEIEQNIETGEMNTRCEQIRADTLGITLEELYAQQTEEQIQKTNKVWADTVWDMGLIQLYRKHMDLFAI